MRESDAPVQRTSDGSAAPPRLRFYLNLATLEDLPSWSEAPTGEPSSLAPALAQSGYHGVQSENPDEYRRYGLGAATLGRANTADEIIACARRWSQAGYDCGTMHIGWGFENDSKVAELAQVVVDASAQFGIPLYVETHRATITQDPWRTLQMIEKVPDVRLNGDFSHWYTGSEMVYGDFDNKLELLQPVLQRIFFIHARVGNSGAMQVPLADPSMDLAMQHYREMWTRSMSGFLQGARAGDYLIFAPELLCSSINYARRYRSSDGRWLEDGDRWLDALALLKVAHECFETARRLTPA